MGLRNVGVWGSSGHIDWGNILHTVNAKSSRNGDKLYLYLSVLSHSKSVLGRKSLQDRVSRIQDTENLCVPTFGGLAGVPLRMIYGKSDEIW